MPNNMLDFIRGKKPVSREELVLDCYIEGEVETFPVFVSRAAMVNDLYQLINQTGKLNLGSEVLRNVVFWKVEAPVQRALDEIEWRQYQDAGVRLNNPGATISNLWPQPPPKGFIHIFVKVPRRGPHTRLLVQNVHPPHEEAITFTVPTKRGLRLKRSDVSANEIEQATYPEAPPFLQAYYNALDCRRVIPLNSALAINDFSRSGISFDTYFRRQSSQDENVAGPATVTDSEIFHYMNVLLCRGHLREDRFLNEKNGQINAIFLDILAGAFIRGGIKAEFMTSWRFPLLAVPEQGERKTYRYTSTSDFRLEIKKFPHFILEVVSDPVNQVDRWYMLLQASCLARLGNRLRKGDTNVPVVIMAIYIDAQLRAHEYLVYQPDISRKKVVYHERMLDLTEPPMSFKFLFRLYNFLSQSTVEKDKLVDSLEDDLVNIRNGVPRRQYTSLTSKEADDCLGDRLVQESLEAAGYELTPTDGTNGLIPIIQLKPTMREATSSDGSHVVLKVVDDDTDELSILKELNRVKSAANHTIELHGIVHTSVANVIAVLWRIPFHEYIDFYDAFRWVATFPEQILEGVAFLHHHRVAHLDLKPENVVVDRVDHKRPPRILIIDFGLSIFVEDEHTIIEGFRGTPPWVAPEVGTYGGPPMEYSAILADRWACGRMICHIEGFLPGGGNESQGRVQEKETIRDQLMSDDPRSRPSLKKVLDVYQRGEVKSGLRRRWKGVKGHKSGRA